MLAVSGNAAAVALIAYTTSQPWMAGVRPLGVEVFDQREAADLGQSRAFVMDLRRLAAVPIDKAWFPRLNQPGAGVLGRMPRRRQRTYLQIAEELLTRQPAHIDRLGPLWPDSRR